MVYRTRGTPKTEAERAATHQAIYGTEPPAVRLGRNPYNRQYVTTAVEDDDMLLGSILFVSGIAAGFAFLEFVLPYLQERF